MKKKWGGGGDTTPRSMALNFLEMLKSQTLAKLVMIVIESKSSTVTENTQKSLPCDLSNCIKQEHGEKHLLERKRHPLCSWHLTEKTLPWHSWKGKKSPAWTQPKPSIFDSGNVTVSQSCKSRSRTDLLTVKLHQGRIGLSHCNIIIPPKLRFESSQADFITTTILWAMLRAQNKIMKEHKCCPTLLESPIYLSIYQAGREQTHPLVNRNQWRETTFPGLLI